MEPPEAERTAPEFLTEEARDTEVLRVAPDERVVPTARVTEPLREPPVLNAREDVAREALPPRVRDMVLRDAAPRALKLPSRCPRRAAWLRCTTGPPPQYTKWP